MPIHHCILHFIDKKPDGSPSTLHRREAELAPSEAIEHLLADLNDSYNAKPGKGWGYFQEDVRDYPLKGWLEAYLTDPQDFVAFSSQAVQHLQALMEHSNLATGGHVLFAHYQQGMTEYLIIALLHQTQGISVSDSLELVAGEHLDLSQLHLAARINLSEWQNNARSKQYISFIKGRNGRKVSDYFRDFIGCQEGVDAPTETQTLLKAFSDYVDSSDLPEQEVREKTEALVDYASTQARLGQSINLEELSEVLDEERPRTFYNHIRNRDYGLAPEIPADKRTLNQFKRISGRAEGLSISFEAHLLGSQVEYDESREVLIIRQLPSQLREQLKKRQS